VAGCCKYGDEPAGSGATELSQLRVGTRYEESVCGCVCVGVCVCVRARACACVRPCVRARVCMYAPQAAPLYARKAVGAQYGPLIASG
jgi:hypothetical protein